MLNISSFYTDIKKEEISININSLNIKANANCQYILDDQLLKDYCRINNVEFKTIFEQFNTFFTNLNYKDKNSINEIKSLLGKKQCTEYFLYFKETINNFFCNANSYYFKVLNARKQFTGSFTNILNYEKPFYDHCSTVTGRAKITKGTNYLVMKKQEKEKLSCAKGKILFEIDIKSCEPNLLSSLLGKDYQEDIYQNFKSKQNRSKVKLATISTLYGLNTKRCIKMTGVEKETILKIKEYFHIDAIEKYLASKFIENNYIQNVYGRHLLKDTSLLNHFLQSTAADYCMLAFQNLCKNKNLNPKAIIHDAIIFEVDAKRKKEIMLIKNVTDPITNISLPVDKKILHE